ncbi:MAG TPA: hypothetical protein DCE80_16800 [Ignavibacteriales bacterium]|nr:hypothetical protein [Ignavibacteriales bacterium]
MGWISLKSAENFGSDQDRDKARFPLQTMLLAVVRKQNEHDTIFLILIISSFLIGLIALIDYVFY